MPSPLVKPLVRSVHEVAGQRVPMLERKAQVDLLLQEELREVFIDKALVEASPFS